MDRIKELDKLSESLEGLTVLKKVIWVVMDKKRGLIVKGDKSHRTLVLVSDEKDRKRPGIYNSEGSAGNAIPNTYFGLGTGVRDYLDMTYGIGIKPENCLEPIKARLLVKI